MDRWSASGLVRAGARSSAGRFALRVLRDLGNLALIDRGMTLAATAFTSVLPMLIVAGALRSRLDPQTGPIFVEHLGFDDATADILENSLPGGVQELRATGVIGVVVLIIAATSLARALERALHTIWHSPAVSLKFAWRWFVTVFAVILGLALIVVTRIIVRGDGPIPVIEFIAEVVLWGVLWWIASWIVINRRVSLGELLPGSVLAGFGFAVAGLVGRVVLPTLFADSASRYGVLGIGFTYIGWLLVLAIILLIALTVGRVVHLTSTGQAWRRSKSAPG